MLKQSVLLLSSLLFAQSAMATITVNVKNDAKYDVTLKSHDTAISFYSWVPEFIGDGSSATFQVTSLYPTTVNVVDVDYQIENGYSKPSCHFRFVMLTDYRSGGMMPQPLIANDEGGSYGNRAKCKGRVDAVDINGGGNATVTFTIEDSRY